MRRVLVSMAVIACLSIVIGIQSARAASKPAHFTAHFLGAPVSNHENVYDVRGNPRGAAIQIFKTNAKGTAGTDTTTGYYGTGTLVSKDAYTLSNAKGIVTIKGTGHFVSGTGIYKHVKGTYKFTGTSNIKTRVIRVTVTGTIAL
jgi:hypothetical protein